MNNEKCWIIYGIKIGWLMIGYSIFESEGSVASVNFNWEKIVNGKNWILGFNHTHPCGLNEPSAIDDKTMAGWVKCIGKPLVCGIKGNKQVIYLYKRDNKEVCPYSVRFFKIWNMLFTWHKINKGW